MKKTTKKKKSKANRGKGTIAVYIILRVLVIGTLVIQAIHGNWDNVFTCALALLLFLVPSFLERRMKIDLPDTLEVIILLFIFAAEILGEIQGYYVIFERWDDILHTMNGFLCAAIGFSLVDLLNKHDRVHMDLSPMFVALVAFSFSMTVGVLWEFFEFSADYFLGADMQKDTWLSTINSVSLGDGSTNEVVSVEIKDVLINGNLSWKQYLDIGLYDTMHDLFVNFIGAVTFSILGLIYIKNRGKGFVSAFMPKKVKSEE